MKRLALIHPGRNPGTGTTREKEAGYLSWYLRPTVLLLFIAVALLAACTVSQSGTLQMQATAVVTATADTATDTPSPPERQRETQAIDAQGLDFAERRVIDVYNQVAPSVVNVTTQVLRRGFFFEVIPEEGTGSGFVIDTEGHILTNYHVIEGARQIEVELEAGLVFPAKVVGQDRRFDLAVLQIEASADRLHPVTFGRSADLQVGQRAIAIGNPFGQFSRTLTTGVISALDRTLEGRDGRPISGVIQTDAAINRGNSGGPLLDSSGRVIGINTAIFSPSGTSAGVGFAVPIDTVSRVLPDLMTLGRYRHPYLGIRFSYRVTPGLAEVLGLPVESGLLLVQLYRNSPLDRAGVRGAQQETIIGNRRVYIGGDILTGVNGLPVESEEQLQLILGEHQVGDRVTVSLMRGEEPFEVQITLTEEPE